MAVGGASFTRLRKSSELTSRADELPLLGIYWRNAAWRRVGQQKGVGEFGGFLTGRDAPFSPEPVLQPLSHARTQAHNDLAQLFPLTKSDTLICPQQVGRLFFRNCRLRCNSL